MASSDDSTTKPGQTAGQTDEEAIPLKTNVLLAVDDSPHAEYAAQYYLDRLFQPNHNVVLAHCTEPPRLPTSVAAIGVGEVMEMPMGEWEQTVRVKRKELKQLKKKFNHLLEKKQVKQHHVRVLESTGSAGPAIIQMADEEKADLIVMGTRGQGVIRRTILGSVSDYVMHHAAVPVMVCHLPPDHPDYSHHHHHHVEKKTD